MDGNPWVLYSEERYQKFLAFLEEVSQHKKNVSNLSISLIFSFENYFQGNYTDFSLLGLPAGAKVASAKVKIAI